MREHFHVGQPGDPVDEITRHGRVEVAATGQHPDFGDMRRQKNDALTRGVACADNDDLLVGA